MRKIAIVSIIVLCLSCAPLETGKKSGDALDINTSVSSNVLLDPPMQGQNMALVKIIDPTNSDVLDLSNTIIHGLVRKGYQVTNYPDSANYKIIGNIVYAGEGAPAMVQKAHKSRYGTRLALVRTSNNDLIAKAVSRLMAQKAYLLIVDVNIQVRQSAKGRSIRQSNKVRIVSDMGNYQEGAERLIGDRVSNAVLAMF